MKTILIILTNSLLATLSSKAQPANGIYILNLYDANYNKLITDTNQTTIFLYNLNKVGKPYAKQSKPLQLFFTKSLYVPIKTNTQYTNLRLVITHLEDTMTINFIDVDNHKQDTLFDLVVMPGQLTYYRNAERRLLQVYAKPIELENIVNIKNEMLRGLTQNALNYLQPHQIITAKLVQPKTLFQKKSCPADQPHPINGQYTNLCCNQITTTTTSLNITTKAKPSTFKNYPFHRFFINECGNKTVFPTTDPIRISQLTNTLVALQQLKLTINQVPYTGIVAVATFMLPYHGIKRYNNSHTVYTVNLYQYANGNFEKLDTYTDSIFNAQQRYQVQLEKPILYLYPTTTQNIKVQLQHTSHTITTSYPTYNAGWQVQATPNGELRNLATNKLHYGLYWETAGKPIIERLRTGTVVKGSNTQQFLETQLAQLGLNYKEANEFIIYWLPQLEKNPYNAIYFATTEYEAESKLTITPKPNTTIRVIMLWQPFESDFMLLPQILPPTPIRKGFVAVEWGGSKVSCFYRFVP